MIFTSPESLAGQYGTPLYIYRLDQATKAWQELRRELPGRSLLHYSLKANPHPDLVALYLRLGARAEVSSSGELDSALAAGARAYECLYTGPAKSETELLHAITNGVRRFSVESEPDYRRVEQVAAATGAQVECLVRVSAQASGATSIRMSGAASQFGVELESLSDLPDRFRSTAHARIIGVHLFPVSNVQDEASLLEVLTDSIRHAREAIEALGITPEFVDLGGGFAAPYAAPGSRPRYTGLRPALEAALDEYLGGWRSGRPVIAFESGRHLAGDSGQYVCTVMDVKTSGSRTFVVLDGGINHLGGMSGLGRLLRPSAEPELKGVPGGEVTLVGPLCTPADVLGLSIRIPPVEPGDILVFPNTGAYGLTASLTAFLSRPAPVEVVVDRETVVSATRVQTFRCDIDSSVRAGMEVNRERR